VYNFIDAASCHNGDTAQAGFCILLLNKVIRHCVKVFCCEYFAHDVGLLPEGFIGIFDSPIFNMRGTG
jgi:hypothetical protein